jgi:hypothetical protein
LHIEILIVIEPVFFSVCFFSYHLVVAAVVAADADAAAPICRTYVLNCGLLREVGARYTTLAQVDWLSTVFMRFGQMEEGDLKTATNCCNSARGERPWTDDRLIDVFHHRLVDSHDRERFLHQHCGLGSGEHEAAWRTVLQFFLTLARALSAALIADIRRAVEHDAGAAKSTADCAHAVASPLRAAADYSADSDNVAATGASTVEHVPAGAVQAPDANATPRASASASASARRVPGTATSACIDALEVALVQGQKRRNLVRVFFADLNVTQQQWLIQWHNRTYAAKPPE